MTLANQAAVDALVGAWAAAWNAHDMSAAAALVASDVDFVTVAGRWLRGRGEFSRHHRDIHLRHLRETTWSTLGYAVRPLREDLALVHLEWRITGERDAAGAPCPPRSGIFTWIVAHDGAAGLIAVAHNTNLRVGTAGRLTDGGGS